jgi:hypothetical protein
MSLTNCRCCLRSPALQFAVQRATARLEAITLGKLRHSNISRKRPAGICTVVTQVIYGRSPTTRLTAAAAVFSSAEAQIWDARHPAANK